jgi:hypothetical protein
LLGAGCRPNWCDELSQKYGWMCIKIPNRTRNELNTLRTKFGTIKINGYGVWKSGTSSYTQTNNLLHT